MQTRQRLDNIERQLDSIERQLDSIYTALVVRDPGTSTSVEAYEGLRRQVIASARERTAHLAQLAEFDTTLRLGLSPNAVADMSRQWMDLAGVAVIEDPTDRTLFEGDIPATEDVEVDRPAYVERETARLIRQGRLRRRSERATTQQIAGES